MQIHKEKNKAKHVMKKGSITTKYIEYKHKNTGPSSCRSIPISELQWFNSSRLICFNWACNKVFTSFLLEMNLWKYDKSEVFMHKKNSLWEVTKAKCTVYKKEDKVKTT